MTDTTNANIPGAAPLVDANGQITMVWYQFLLALFNRTGGSGTPPDITGLQQQVDAQDVEINSFVPVLPKKEDSASMLALSMVPRPTKYPLDVLFGGTGATSALAARNNLGLGSVVTALNSGCVQDWNGTTGTDNNAALQAALNSLPFGGTLVIDPGLAFLYSGTLNVPAGVTVYGAGATLISNNLTSTCITLNATSAVRFLNLTATAAKTSGATVAMAGNFSLVDQCQFSNYYQAITALGLSSSNLIINPRINGINCFSPSLTVGGSVVFARDYGNLYIEGITASGPLAGTQPSQGIALANGDTAFISNSNITHHGAALNFVPPVGNNVFATQISNSLFDSAGGNSCCLMSGAGGVFDTKFANCWFGLAFAGNSGCLINPTGTVDGVAFTGCEFVANGDSGLRVNGTGAKNIKVNGGWASGNTNGFNFSGGVSHFSISDVTAGPASGRGPNSQFGIIVQAGASDYYTIAMNDVNGNTVGGVADSGTGTHKTVVNNLV